MFTLSEKNLPKWCLLILFIILFFDICLSVRPHDSIDWPRALEEHDHHDHRLANVTKINTPTIKKKCNFPDGTPSSCPTEIEEQENGKKSNLKETIINLPKENDKINVTNINTLKNNCTEMLNNTLINCTENELLNKTIPINLPETITTSTTENAEIVSMTDHAHKYTGGQDVDELKPTKISNIENQKINLTNGTIKNAENKPENSTVDENSISDHVEIHESFMKKMQTTTAAGIAAGICILFAATAYISLMLWKKISYKRYGNREMLLNEDDLGDIHDEDMRHFELKLLDKDGKVIET